MSSITFIEHFNHPRYKKKSFEKIVQELWDAPNTSKDDEDFDSSLELAIALSLNDIPTEGDKLEKHEEKNPNQFQNKEHKQIEVCLLYTSPSPRDKRQSRMPSSA